jgi:hypothetical protein
MSMAVRSTFQFSAVLSMMPAALVLASLAGGVQAQQSFLIDAGPCLALTTPVERLACFEDQVRTAQSLQSVAAAVVTAPTAAQPAASVAPAASAAVAPVAAAPAAAASQPAAAVDAAANFGLREKPAKDEKAEELLATVASVRQFAPGKLQVTLDNGQVWRQTSADNYKLREGHAVRIYATRWGNNFRLTAKDLGGFIQVERVQ